MTGSLTGKTARDFNGMDAVIDTFGLPPEDPKERAEWESQNLVTFTLPSPLTVKNPFTKKETKALKLSYDTTKRATKMRLHYLVVPVAQQTFQYLFVNNLYPLILDYGGSYLYRPKRNVSQLSMHAFGIAFDINVKQNPLGAVPKMPHVLVEAIEKFGWYWGGRFYRPDGMHFQFCVGA